MRVYTLILRMYKKKKREDTTNWKKHLTKIETFLNPSFFQSKNLLAAVSSMLTKYSEARGRMWILFYYTIQMLNEIVYT